MNEVLSTQYGRLDQTCRWVVDKCHQWDSHNAQSLTARAATMTQPFTSCSVGHSAGDHLFIPP
jgi:hypothetical protein